MGNRKDVQIRDIGKLESDQELEDKIIRGHFIVCNSETELYPGVYEEVSPEALTDIDFSDIKGLIDHDSAKVLGRTKSNTLTLSVDKTGLYGEIIINDSDQEAMNLYHRVKRGDVDQCSFGFRILDEEMMERADGTIKFVIKKIELFEVSIVTFPAYQDTAVEARSKQIAAAQERTLDVRKQEIKEKLNGIKTTYFGA